ncbi:MAG: AhpC/TSA family protein [Bacteroidales bacterium]|nr:AhpC/TSA family protein [Bacteroidales bacterium]
MKNIILILAVIISISACNTNKTGFEINGHFENSNGELLLLKLMGSNQLITIDSAVIDESGNFNFSGEIEGPNFYMIEKDQQNYLTIILNPGEKVTVSGDANDLLKKYDVKGSRDSELLKEFTGELMASIEKLTELSKIYQDSIQSPKLSEIMQDLNKKSEVIIQDMRAYTISFIEENPSSLASLMALYQQLAPRQYILNPETDLKYYILVDSTLYSLYPESDPVKTLHSHVANLNEQNKIAEASGDMIGIGSVPPEIALPSPKGDTIKLSSTIGKVVLLDFWASWCSPCRMESPNLVSNYKKYHSQGFEIFQVSLDKTKENWMAGIKDDHLQDWIHVSDLKFWQSSVVPMYKIQGIPANFLLDKEGKVIATNLRGNALGAKLQEIFGN